MKIRIVKESAKTRNAKMNSTNLTLWTAKTRPVDYFSKTSTRKHYHETLGVYHADPLSAGNAKLDPSILIFDMLAVNTCLNCDACRDTCYAMKAQVLRPAVYSKRAINTWLARFDLGYLGNKLDEQLLKTKLETVRIHTSGDFISQAYINMWKNLAKFHRNIKFYFYTKVDCVFDFSDFTALPNVNMVHSILPDGELNYGDIHHCLDMVDKYGAILCPYGVKNMDPVQCGTECRFCMNAPYVVFKQH